MIRCWRRQEITMGIKGDTFHRHSSIWGTESALHRLSCRSAWTASEEPSCQHARDTRWPTVSHKHGARRASTCAAAAGIPAAGRGQHACTFLPATSASHPCSCLTPPKPGGIAPRRTTVVQLLCSRASKPDVAPWQRLAAMVEAAAGTVGDRPAATGGAADGSETRKLESEALAREEIYSYRTMVLISTGSHNQHVRYCIT